MAFTKSVIFTAIIFCASLSIISSIRIFSRSHEFLNKRIFHDYASFENMSYVFALCNKSPSGQFTNKCTFVSESHDFDSEFNSTSCDVELPINRRNVLIGNGFRVYRFGDDKAIALWWEKDATHEFYGEDCDIFVKFFVIHFDECKTYEDTVVLRDLRQTQIGVITSTTILVTRKDSFELIYPNPAVCVDKFCWQTFDATGLRINGPVAWFKIPEFPKIAIATVDSSATTDSFVVVEEKLLESKVYLYLLNNGTANLLQAVPSDNWRSLKYSTSYSLIGLCSAGKHRFVECAQYDASGNFKLQIRFNRFYQSVDTAMYNTKDGGFLLLTAESVDCGRGVSNVVETNSDFDYVSIVRKDCGRRCMDYHVATYDEELGEKGAIEMRGLDGAPRCEEDYRSVAVRLFEKSVDEYCVTFSRYYSFELPDSLNRGRFDFNVKCFTDADFS